MKSKSLFLFAACFGAFGVGLGAFASHGLKAILSPDLLGVFEVGVRYQFIHTLALLGCGVMMLLSSQEKVQKYFYRAGICFIIGIFCFSGSLYALALTGVKWFGPITPFGGVCFILGWLLMFVAALNMKEVNQ
ncbi:DUF423 domain-containing protein [Vibrio mangrovi]|uniref:DUF423 domain-containing protein n=1 Tax=Vibrio mangrovi TaxID=474394 RepID=A0A1Y6IQC0_9VIBR|nr:DUF423 domain-containing protein [Vibrio mangrovi]MDW6003371.1 DUF423 domain-containing protein [Vibrio mangrovi]SMR99839.1 hypothetical protein VIM7927_01072 [Vibrio mangrovi]